MEQEMRKQFPIFTEYSQLVYLDSAATTQKPFSVIQSITDYYTKYNANVHRGLYKLADASTKLYEDARVKVARFINADPEEIIFTGGATESLNIIALSLQKSKLLSSNPKILLTDLEHHSNLVPWQQLQPERIDYLKIDENFQIMKLDETSNRYTDPQLKYDIFSIPYISNVTGTILPVKELIAEQTQSFSVIDASQAVGHMKIDVRDINCDFMAFSGHKMYGPQGIGILYIKKQVMKRLVPVFTGGGMIREVTTESTTWSDGPSVFEAGTPHIAGAFGLAAAVDFITLIGFEEIAKHEQELRNYAIYLLKQIPEVTLFHPIEHIAGGVISFSVKDIHAHDIAQFLGDAEICIRAGHHCAQPLHRMLGTAATARVSFGVYNSKDDIDRFIVGLKEGIEVYGKG